jgi:exodeoxyribonuclease-1
MAAPTFFFYDLETSGLDPRKHRIMQFAGIRTGLDLEPIGQPINLLVKLTPEVLPDPRAISVTGITPQETLKEGLNENEALRRIMEEAFRPDTTAVGFNNIRFDDEFMRYSAYRNFWDPYEWAYQDGRSRWDILDVVRLVRAMRPEGITWPVDDDGAPINTLERIASANGVAHLKAHDALSDVEALIAVTKLIRDKQPKMYQYLLDGRTKEAVSAVVSAARPTPFVYASGRFGKSNNFTTVAVAVGYGDNKKVVVYDLRHDPTPYLKLSVQQLREIRFTKWEDRQKPDYLPLPAKELTPNKCPAVAPFGTMHVEDAARLGIDLEQVKRNLELLQSSELGHKLVEIFTASNAFPKTADVDAALYDGFVGQSDKAEMTKIRRTDNTDLASLKPTFSDARLPELWLRYRGRNAPEALNPEETESWKSYVKARRTADLPAYSQALAALRPNHDDLATALEEWGELTT